MESEWPIIKLGEFVDITTGFPFKSKNFVDTGEGYRLLRGDNIIQGSFRWQNVKLWPTSELIEKHQNYFLKNGDVILAMDRPWIEAGLKTGQIGESDLPCLLVQRVACLRAKDLHDQNFLRYLISSYWFIEYIKLVQTGTAVPHISAKQIQNYEFRKPPKKDRLKIGALMRSLDDKIELNRQTNQTLEAMAQALFKSWFVDFDPVIDNALEAGNPIPEPLQKRADIRQALRQSGEAKALPEDIRALFPCGFVMSEEMGWVPEGWGVMPVSQAIAINPKVTLPKGTVATFVDMKALPTSGYSVLYTERKGYSGGAKFELHDVLMARITPCLQNGKTALVDFLSEGEVGFGSTEFITFRGKGSIGYTFIACLIRDNVFRKHCCQSMVGSSGRQRVQNSCFNDFFLAYPNDGKLLQLFEKMNIPSFDKISINKEASASLVAIRDTLLPKLISGELRIPEAEAQIEEAVA